MYRKRTIVTGIMVSHNRRLDASPTICCGDCSENVVVVGFRSFSSFGYSFVVVVVFFFFWYGAGSGFASLSWSACVAWRSTLLPQRYKRYGKRSSFRSRPGAVLGSRTGRKKTTMTMTENLRMTDKPWCMIIYYSSFGCVGSPEAEDWPSMDPVGQNSRLPLFWPPQRTPTEHASPQKKDTTSTSGNWMEADELQHATANCGVSLRLSGTTRTTTTYHHDHGGYWVWSF